MARTLVEIPVAPTASGMSSVPSARTPEQAATERELSGGVFSAQNAAPASAAIPNSDAAAPGGVGAGPIGDLASLLRDQP